ncbi:MAG: HEPN domain-containing protein [Kiritimatiellae bacterium]|nr:HEPN domain-containing protein [Kiritimatiellia bacterium]MDD4623469.1 HEPN domain-containing protein [Kiritimatiellia bacterium]
MTKFINEEKERAKLALDAARMIVAVDPNSAANRAYYAVFHAFTAFFATRGQAFTRHATLRNAIHRDLVHAAIIPVTMGQDFDFLMEMREAGDYGGLQHVSPPDASEAVATASRILELLFSMF